VSYQLRFEGAALVQLHGIAPQAFDALVERVRDLVDAPWDAAVMPPGSDPSYRITMFGAGLGVLTFYVDDQAELIRVFDIAWIG
jgi:hypothetical protein